MLAGRRERLAGAGQLLLRQGVINGELPASLDVDAVTRGFLALLDGLMLQRIEAGDAYRPADLERRADGHRGPAAGTRPGAGRDGVASRAMAHVQTVLGPIEPDALGFTLPHEHTQIALWHIQSRWDYWQLTRDEPVILEELARYRAAGGSGLVDLTLPGVGRDPAWLRGLARGQRPARRHGLRLVPDGLLPARGADRAPLRRRPRRRARAPRSRPGWGRRASGPGSSARSARTSRGSRRPRSGSIGRRRARHGGRASPITTHGVLSDVGLAQLADLRGGGRRPGRVIIGHADSYPFLDHYLAILERGANLEFDFLGMPWERERLERGAHRRARVRAARPRPRRPAVPQPGRLQRLAAHGVRRQRLHVPHRRRSCRGCEPPASRTPRSKR